MLAVGFPIQRVLASHMWDRDLLSLSETTTSCRQSLRPDVATLNALLRRTRRCDGSGSRLWNRPQLEDMEERDSNDIDESFRDSSAGIACEDSGDGLTKAKNCESCGKPVCNVSSTPLVLYQK